MKINKEQIITIIKNLPAKVKYTIKTVYDLPHAGKYMALSVLLLFLFLIITFPYDSIITKKIYSMEGKSFRTIEMGGFDFSIFGETYIDKLAVVLNNGNEITCKNAIVNLSVNPLTLIVNRRIKSDFQFDSLKYAGKDTELQFNVNGNVDIKLDEKTGLPGEGPVRIILSDSNLIFRDLSIPGPMGPLPLNIESVNIQSGNIDSIISNGVLRFNTFKLTGNDISCDITGTIDLANNSRLDLLVNIDSESAVLDQYKDVLASLIKNNVLTFRIRGNVSKPELTISSADKNEN